MRSLVEGFKLMNRDKDVRIRTLIPHFERGQIFIRSWMTELMQELIRFPKGKTKDIIDILASGVKYILHGRVSNMWKSTNVMNSNAWYK